MKDHPPFPFDGTESERFIDASLREHARLGAAPEDSDLVRSILMETVDAPMARRSTAGRRIEERKAWIAGVAAAAAIVGAIAAVLATLPFRHDSREVEEIRFIVQYGDNAEIATTPDFTAPVPRRDPVLFSSPTEARVDLPPLNPEPLLSMEPAPTNPAFGPTFSNLPSAPLRENTLKIEADETTASSTERIYEGNVEVTHGDFRLHSDRVVLSLGEPGQDDGAVLLTASNAILEHHSPGRAAMAGEIEYEPAINRFSLHRVVYVDSAEGRLNAFADDDVVFLMGGTLVVRNAVQP